MLDTLIPRAVEPLRWLLILVIALILATTVLFFMAPADSGMPGAAAGTGTGAGAAATPAVNIDRIVNRHLFGIASAVPEDQREVQETIEETRLPLELNGVFVAEQPEFSAAIIAQRGKPGTLYNIGDNVPGNAKLVEVHAAYVVLRRAGVRETLRFPELKDQFAADVATAPAPNARRPDGRMDRPVTGRPPVQRPDRARPGAQLQPVNDDPPRNARDFVDRYRDKLESDPDAALSELGVEPVATGSAAGYKLGNLADSPYLSKTGLQAGDVVLSVNGRPVGDVRQDRMQLDSIMNQGSARLEIQRGSRRFFVTASLR